MPAIPPTRGPFDELCDALEVVLEGNTRGRILDRLPRTGDPSAGLREGMRGHRFHADRVIALGGLVDLLDRATVRDGFHVLHTWDPRHHRFLGDNTPVLLLGYLQPFGGRDVRREQALLLDAYFLHLLVLLAMRAWDTDHPDAAMDRLDGLVQLLQGEHGCGRQFVRGWPMLIGLAIAQYQPDERGFDALLARIRLLDASHELAMARCNAANFGAHLRWGARYMYDGDVERMRRDNVVDYPWVMHAAATLARALVAGDRSPAVMEALLQVLSADPTVILGTGAVPEVLAGVADERVRCAEHLRAHADELQRLCGEHRPAEDRFSPLGFHFNFLHNVLTATLAEAVATGAPNVPLDDLLLTGPMARRVADTPDALAHQLGLYAAHPDRRGARHAPLIVVDAPFGASCLDALSAACGAAR